VTGTSSNSATASKLEIGDSLRFVKDRTISQSLGQPASDATPCGGARLRAARRSLADARNPAAQYGTSRSCTLARSLDRHAPPESLSIRPVSANVSVSAPDRN
jgi:hypothetical protein